MSKINIARAKCRVRARQHQLSRYFKGARVRPFEHERTSIREDSSVEAGRNLRSNGDARFARQSINHFGRSHRLRIDPVHLAEWAPALVMIDVDQKLIFQAPQPGALDAIALENDGGFVFAIDRLRLDDFSGIRQRLVNSRHPIAQNNISILAHGTQNLTKGQSRADSIAVWPRMRGQDKPVVPLDMLKYILQHKDS